MKIVEYLSFLTFFLSLPETSSFVARKEANPSLIYNSTRNYKLDDDTGTSGWKKVDRYDCAGHLAEFLYK